MNLEQLIFTWHFPVDTGRKLNVHKNVRLMYVQFTSCVYGVIVLALFVGRRRLEPQRLRFGGKKL